MEDFVAASAVMALVHDDLTKAQWTKLLSYYGENVKVAIQEIRIGDSSPEEPFIIAVTLDHLKYHEEVLNKFSELLSLKNISSGDIFFTEETGFSILFLDWTAETSEALAE